MNDPPIKRRRLTGDALEPSPKIERRNFLVIAAVSTWLTGIALALMGALRSALPSVLPDPSKRFKIGTLKDFTPGSVKEFTEESVIVFADDDGLYAISKICTHLGCVILDSDNGFRCPCHGSLFAPDGKVLKGPAPRDLEWYAIESLPGGQLVVNRSKVIERGSKTPIT